MEPHPTQWPGVSVVIPTWNGLPLLSTYLPSVRAALETYPGPWECLVVDDGGADATSQELPNLFPAARYLRRERNEGFAAAANTGFEEAMHGLVLLLNNDIRVEAEFLLPLAGHFRAGPTGEAQDLFAVVSLQINPGGGGAVNPAFDGARVLRFRKGELSLPTTAVGAEGEARRLSALANGGCSLFSRAKVRAIGGFCTLFNPFYFEDAELSLQAWRRGWRIVFEPRSSVLHRPNSTTRHHATKITTTAVRNSFFFQWLVLDGVAWWGAHAAWILPRVLSRVLRGDFEHVQGLGRALRSLPEVVRARAARGQGAVKRLRELPVLEN